MVIQKRLPARKILRSGWACHRCKQEWRARWGQSRFHAHV